MGFRDYSPGLNRFLTRDMYNGALADLRLGSDPWTGNRYAFAGGNPITGIEQDGHCPMAEEGGCAPSTGSERPASEPTIAKPPTVANESLRRIVADTYAKEGETSVRGDGKAATALEAELVDGARTNPALSR